VGFRAEFLPRKESEMILPEIVIYYLALFSGFTPTQAHTMVCIAEYESSYNTRAYNLNKELTEDKGLLQINTIWHTNKQCSGDLYNPVINMQCAKFVFDIQGFNAWYGYRKNKTECDSRKVKEVK